VTHLVAALYLDEDVDVLIAKLLCARGFRAVTTLEAAMLGAQDANNSITRLDTTWQS